VHVAASGAMLAARVHGHAARRVLVTLGSSQAAVVEAAAAATTAASHEWHSVRRRDMISSKPGISSDTQTNLTNGRLFAVSRRCMSSSAGKGAGEDTSTSSSSGGSAAGGGPTGKQNDGKSESDRRYEETGEHDTQERYKRVGNPISWANPTGGGVADDNSSKHWRWVYPAGVGFILFLCLWSRRKNLKKEREEEELQKPNINLSGLSDLGARMQPVPRVPEEDDDSRPPWLAGGGSFSPPPPSDNPQQRW